ncbi:hypothetical protein ACFE04_015127 [Oxalis oulophora]
MAANSVSSEAIKKETPRLEALLKEMKEGLDIVTNKVQDLTAKVKRDEYPTAEGMSYLEAKNLLLLNYCMSLVYYLLRKAKGFSIDGHPVVRSLVEIRLFLEKIRPIDKKLQYQIQKLTRMAVVAPEQEGPDEKNAKQNQNMDDDLLKYRPNPDMVVSEEPQDASGLYKPPKLVPYSMEEDTLTGKQERNARRKDKETLQRATGSAYMRDMINDVEGRPEEIREIIGSESRELTRYLSQREKREQQEEELFTRAPITKKEKKREKHLKKSRNGLLGLADNFYDEIKSLPLEDGNSERKGFTNGSSKNFKKCKTHHKIIVIERDNNRATLSRMESYQRYRTDDFNKERKDTSLVGLV